MNELGVDFGYVLYESEVLIASEESVLKVENIRDFAAVYLDNELQGAIADNHKQLRLKSMPGKYRLRLYVENIGRITYGPEILDNLKGVFGEIQLNEEIIKHWTLTELKVKSFDIKHLKFSDIGQHTTPGFYKATFLTRRPRDKYLDLSGWGMGEAWINGNYLGSFWEQENQQSILIPAALLRKGMNEIVVFELKNNQQKSFKFSDVPVFK
ncbi:MAG: hypothetical protein PHU68_00645 [Paludibacter sp.]|nr:hypothetical protein [Paludibacter sp.]